MQFEKINIEQIKPAEYNPRIMPQKEMEKLKKGLNTFGLVDPIIIDLTDQNTVIGGHQRLEVLKEIDDEMELQLIRLGDIGLVIKETELRIKDKNDQKALNLALNKISGTWDYQKLDDVLLELNEDNYQLELTGFDGSELLLNVDDYNTNEILTEIEKDFEFKQDESVPNNNHEDTKTDNTVSSEFREIFKVEIIFKSEQEMTEQFDKLVELGYNVRMSGS